MNISYNWLRDLIDINLSPDEVANELTSVGLAVEGIHAIGSDFVFDIDLTSNRPDCLSHLGIARELRAITSGSLKPSATLAINSKNGDSRDLAAIETEDLCHRFTARVIRGVSIGPSPPWLVDRLEAIGERSINNVADITNYVMHELGQPMHAFDFDKLAGGQIIVRRATAQEKIITLDDVERQLDPSILAICDIEKPVAVAGIMGGLDSSITGDTVNVLLEVAFFDRRAIRAASRKLNLATEASYRFERGVDIENLIQASNRATALIVELAGGTAEEFVDAYPGKFVADKIDTADISATVKRLSGLEVNSAECKRILSSLGISEQDGAAVHDSQFLTFICPSWRHDLAIEEDLVEEVARHTGYDKIASELPPAFGAGEYQPTEAREKLLRQTLTGLGFSEALSYSFIDTRFDDGFQVVPQLTDEASADKYVTLQHSIIEGSVRMRHTVLPGLLDAVRLNLNQQRRDIRLFEIGKIFASRAGENILPNEQKSLGLILTGGYSEANRLTPTRQLDFYDAKGAIEAALEAASISEVSFVAARIKHLRLGQAAEIVVGDTTVGYVGRINDEISKVYKFRQPIFVAELNLSLAMQKDISLAVYRPLARYPAIVRDVSFTIGRGIAFEDIRSTVLGQNLELCTNVLFVDIYEGKGLSEDEQSLTIRLEYRSDERTLVEEEVEVLHRRIVLHVEAQCGVKQRF